MDKTVFPLASVGESYNETFINVKLDAEKGAGPTLARQYEVHVYPTFLYLDADGKLLYRAVGYFAPKAFLAQVNHVQALADDENTLSKLDALFESGERSRDFLRNYITKMQALRVNNSQAVDAYFSSLTWDELRHPDELSFLGKSINNVENSALVFLMNNFDLLSETMQRKIAGGLFSVLLDASGEATNSSHSRKAGQSLAFAKQLLPFIDKQQKKRFYRYNLLYQVKIRDTSGVKHSGRALVGDIMQISLDSIRAEDARRFQTIMAPFLTGEQDSTKIDGFQEEKKYIINTYSREICSNLYEAAKAYAAVLPDQDAALDDALQWMLRCDELMPGTRLFEDLIAALRNRVSVQ